MINLIVNVSLGTACKGGAHLLSLCRLNLSQLWRESATHLLLWEQEGGFAHLIEGNFDTGTFQTTSKYHFTTVPLTHHIIESVKNFNQLIWQTLTNNFEALNLILVSITVDGK